MITFLIVMGVWIIPLWFGFRYLHFWNSHIRHTDGMEILLLVFVVGVCSWIGLGVLLLFTSDDTPYAVRKTFFFKPPKERSLRGRIVWYKIQKFFMALLLVKDND